MLQRINRTIWRRISMVILMMAMLNLSAHVFLHLLETAALSGTAAISQSNQDEEASSLSVTSHTCAGCETISHLKLNNVVVVTPTELVSRSLPGWQIGVLPADFSFGIPSNRAPPRA